MTRTNTDVDKLREKLLTMEWRNETLKAEVSRLAEKIRSGTWQGRAIQDGYADAWMLYLLRLADAPISNRVIVPEYLSRGRWARAIGVLEMSGVMQEKRTVVTNPDEAWYALNDARRKLETIGYRLLKSHLPPRSYR